MSQIRRAFEQVLSDRVKRRVDYLANRLIDATPVCTGYARASWKVKPNVAETDNDTPEPDRKAGCQEQIPRPVVDLTKYKRPIFVWYVSNLAPYIQDLEHGSSKKANPGWIRDTATAAALKRFD